MHLTFGLPQTIWAVLVLMNMGCVLARFGKLKTDRYDIVDFLVAPGISATLLWWGGFFSASH